MRRRAGAFLVLLFAFAADAHAQTPIDRIVEARMVLAYRAADAMVYDLLPDFWKASPIPDGPAKGANLLLALSERDTPQGKMRVLEFIVPAADTRDLKVAGLVMVGGFADPEAAPGLYDLYISAKIQMERTPADRIGPGAIEKWLVEAENGERLEMSMRYRREGGPTERGEEKIFSAAEPGAYFLHRVERQSELVRSIEDGENRVENFSFTVDGQILDALFNGTHRLIAVFWDRASTRLVFKP